MSPTTLSRLAFGILGAALLVHCSTFRDELARGQKAFEQNQHERALATLRALEADLPELTDVERAQYAYLRGMTDYRVGYRAEARHWLLRARAYEKGRPNALPPDWKSRTDDALAKLNESVYEGGYESLSNSRRPTPSAPGSAPESRPSGGTSAERNPYGD